MLHNISGSTHSLHKELLIPGLTPPPPLDCSANSTPGAVDRIIMDEEIPKSPKLTDALKPGPAVDSPSVSRGRASMQSDTVLYRGIENVESLQSRETDPAEVKRLRQLYLRDVVWRVDKLQECLDDKVSERESKNFRMLAEAYLIDKLNRDPNIFKYKGEDNDLEVARFCQATRDAEAAKAKPDKAKMKEVGFQLRESLKKASLAAQGDEWREAVVLSALYLMGYRPSA